MQHSNNNIGLVAWGLKLGKQVFFHSPNIRLDSPSIAVALEDIRGLINYSHPNLTFYSLETTESHRVYTIYNSIFDWVNRDGAYFAFSVFIPHELAVTENGKLLELLLQLAQTYRTLYVEEASNQIKRGQENSGLFLEMVQKLPCRSQLVQSKGGAGNNKRYAHIPFSDPKTLSGFFDDPYRTEFTPFKQVFFLDQALLNAERLRVSASSTLLSITPVTERYSVTLNFGGDSKLSPGNLQQLEVYVNNVPIGKRTAIDKLQKDDVLTISVTAEHYEPYCQKINLAAWIKSGPQTTIDIPISLTPKKYRLLIKVVSDEYTPKNLAETSLFVPEIGQFETNRDGQFITNPLFAYNATITLQAEKKKYQPFYNKENLTHYDSHKDLLTVIIKLKKNQSIRQPGSSDNNRMFILLLALIIAVTILLLGLIFMSIINTSPEEVTDPKGKVTISQEIDSTKNNLSKAVSHPPLDTLEKKAPKPSLQDRINAPIGQHTWRYYDDLAKELTQMEDPNQDKKLMATINKLKKLIILKEEYCQASNFNEKVREKRKTKETFAALQTKIGNEMKACVHSGLLNKQQITEIEKFVTDPNCP
jgi:hypothetical protein